MTGNKLQRVDAISRSQIAKIKMAQKSLDMDDGAYRALLNRIAGKGSCARMTVNERDAVLQEMSRLGWKSKPGKAHPDKPADTAEVPMLRKVEALLTARRLPWNYAHSMAKQMFQVDRLEFLKADQLHRLVAALQIDSGRRS